MKVEVYEPGNATRYELVCGRIEEEDDCMYLLVWLNAPLYGRAMRFAADCWLHYTYMVEKMNIDEGDAAALLRYLRDRYDINVYLPTWAE